MMVGLYYISEKVAVYMDENERFRLPDFCTKNGLEIILHGVFYIPALIPVVSTYLRFGTISLVADVMYVNISGERYTVKGRF